MKHPHRDTRYTDSYRDTNTDEEQKKITGQNVTDRISLETTPQGHKMPHVENVTRKDATQTMIYIHRFL